LGREKASSFEQHRDALIERSKRHRQNYLGFEREYLGWAIFIWRTEVP
jgi:hypothetical protein